MQDIVAQRKSLRMLLMPIGQSVNRPAQPDSGFTLIEVLVVVVILSILAAIIVPRIMDQPDRARVTKAQQDIQALNTGLNLYKLDNFAYPTTDQGLDALINRPASPPEPRNYPKAGYMKSVAGLEDPWGELFHYESPGQHNSHSFDVWSLGADASPGGSDIDADIGNWRDESGQGDLGG